MSDTARDGSNGRHEPYPSVSALKEAHAALLRRHRQGGDAGLLDQVEEFVVRGSATGVYLDSTDDRLAGQSLLDYWVTVLYKAKRTPPDPTLAEFDPSLSPALDDSLCPYRGLNAFQEEDSDLFHGRQRLVEQLVQKLRTQRLLYVVGASGSGKSSLVLAGLVPALRNGVLEGSERWQYLPRMVPGSNPLRSLASVLAGFYGRTAGWAAEQERLLGADPRHLTRLLDESAEPAVLIVDQFEEVFTLCLDDGLRESFAAALAALAESGGSRHLAVITMRTDYEPHLVHLTNLTPLLESGQVRITPLTAADLHEAIEGPARRIGLKFEDGIVDALVKDILGEPAGLPLLQFTLLRLWKMREDGRSRITWAAYRRLGGARRALALTADEFYERLPEEKKVTAKRILLRMVRPSGTSEVMSNRVKRSSLSFEAQYRIDEVLNDLHAAGLVRVTHGDAPGNDQIEVAHEALVRNWPLLVEWVEHDRVAMRQRLRLTAAAEQWFEHGKDEGGLLGGSLLAEALQYDPSELNELEREYVRASREAADAIEAEKAQAAERERQLESERLVALEQKAAEEAKSARRLRIFVPILVVLTLIASATAWYAVRSRAHAVGISEIAATRERERAELAQKNAELAQKNAEQAQEAKRHADYLAMRAETARKKAEDAEKEAIAALEEAKKQKKLADDRAAQLAVAVAKEKKASDEAKVNLERFKELQAKVLGISEKHKEADEKLYSDPNKAVTLYRDILGDYEENQDRRNQLLVRGSLAKVYRIQSELTQEDIGDRGDVVKYLLFMSRAEYKAALQLFDEELKEREQGQPKNASAGIPVLQERAQFHLSQDRPDKAEADYRKALDLQESLLNVNDLSTKDSRALKTYNSLVYSLSRLFKSRNNHQERIDLLKRAMNAKEAVFGDGAKFDLYRLHAALGRAYVDANELTVAEAHFKQALDLYRELQVSDASLSQDTSLLIEFGNLYARMKKYDEAGKLYTRALNEVGRNPEEYTVGAWLGLGTIYEEQKEKRGEVEAAYLKGIGMLEADPELYSEELMAARRKLALFYKVSFRFENAAALYDVLSQDAARDGDNRSYVGYRFMQAEMYDKLAGYDRAKRVYKELDSWLNQNAVSASEANRIRAELYDNLGRVYEREKNFTEAAANYELGLKAAEKNPGRNETHIGRRLRLAEVYDALGRVDDATAQYVAIVSRLKLDEPPSKQRYFQIWRTCVNVLEKYATFLKKHNRTEEADRRHQQAEAIKALMTASSP